MQLPPNTFKSSLLKHQHQTGLFMGMNSPVSAEILATCGFDFLLIDAEHGLYDLPTLQAQLQAVAAYPVHCLVRPVSHDPALIRQLLGIGVQSLLVPMVNTAAQAHALVDAMHYPPRGSRGVGTGLERGARWNAADNYFDQVAERLCLVVQIESLEGLSNLDAICAVPGVDGVFIGPNDLAAAMGYLGQVRHPTVIDTIHSTLKRIRASGKAAGIFCAQPEHAGDWHNSGASFLALGADTALLRNAALQLRQRVIPDHVQAENAAKQAQSSS